MLKYKNPSFSAGYIGIPVNTKNGGDFVAWK